MDRILFTKASGATGGADNLSSPWCGPVTSVPVAVARPLIDGVVNEVALARRADASLEEVRR